MITRLKRLPPPGAQPVRLRGHVLRLRAPNVFYGWYIVIAGIVLNMLMGGLIMHAFHFYVAELKAEFLWPATLFGFAFMLTRIESGVLGLRSRAG